MYYINYDEDTGTIIGIYPSSYSPDDVPEPKITITDEQYNALGDGYYIVLNGALVKEDDEQGFIPIDGTAIYSLQNNYIGNLEKLKNVFIAASIMNADTKDIQNEYQALLADFTRKAIDIEQGHSGEVSTNEYCSMCGTLIDNGVCPNCHWRL